MSACAMPTRCTIPFENLRSCSRRSAPMPTSSSSARHPLPALGGVVAEELGEITRAAPPRSGSRRSRGSPPGSRCAAAWRRGRPAGRESRLDPRSERSAASAASASSSCRRRWARGSRRSRPSRSTAIRRSSARYGRLRQKPIGVVLGQLLDRYRRGHVAIVGATAALLGPLQLQLDQDLEVLGREDLRRRPAVDVERRRRLHAEQLAKPGVGLDLFLRARRTGRRNR